MTDQQFYVEPDGDGNPTIWDRSIVGDLAVARLRGGVEPAYEDLAFAVLARVLTPDEATVLRLAQVVRRSRYGAEPGVNWLELAAYAQDRYRDDARAVLAALAEDPAEVTVPHEHDWISVRIFEDAARRDPQVCSGCSAKRVVREQVSP